MLPQPSRAPTNSPWAALALLMILGAIWGGGTSIAKYLSVAGVPPMGAVFWQTLGATVLLLLVRMRSRHRRPLHLTRPLLAYFAFNGIVGLAIPSANMVFVTGHIPAGMMSVVLTLSPVLTYIGAMVLRLEMLNLRRGGGIALGFAGALLLVLPSGSLPGGAVMSFALLAFLTPVCYAIANVYAEIRRPEGIDSLALAAGATLAAAAGLLVGSLATGQFYPIWQNPGRIELVMVAYMFLTAIAYLSMFSLLRLAGSVYLSQVAYIITVTGIAWGALVFAERPSVWLWVSVAVVFSGVALVNTSRGGRRTKTTTPTPDTA